MHLDCTAQETAAVFLADSDNAIHKALSLRCQRLAHHPFLEHLAKGGYCPAFVGWAYRRRKSVLNNFILLLERAKEKAESVSRAHLADAIHRNLSDEHGLDPVTGCDTGVGAHRQWAQWFLEALDEVDPPGSLQIRLDQYDPEVWNFMPFDASDDLALLVGMCIAVEKCIPIEFSAFLRGLTTAFPLLADPLRPRRTLYLSDHVVHDEQRHLPDLIDGFLGRPPGSSGYIVDPMAIDVNESGELLVGIERILAIRLRFYDQMWVYAKRDGQLAV